MTRDAGPSGGGWDAETAAWWLDEATSDPAYAEEVIPLALDLLRPLGGAVYLDLGCGHGGLMEAVVGSGALAVGVDAAPSLVGRAREWGPVVVGRLPDLAFIADGVADGAILVLVLEHLPEVAPILEEAARVTRSGGVLVVVVNHPLLTAPGSGPFVDPDDGEVLWRWGDYLATGSTDEPVGAGSVRFHHHPLGTLLTEAARAGWSLEAAVERPVGAERAGRDPLLAAQSEVPRLLGGRWVRSG